MLWCGSALLGEDIRRTLLEGNTRGWVEGRTELMHLHTTSSSSRSRGASPTEFEEGEGHAAQQSPSHRQAKTVEASGLGCGTSSPSPHISTSANAMPSFRSGVASTPLSRAAASAATRAQHHRASGSRRGGWEGPVRAHPIHRRQRCGHGHGRRQPAVPQPAHGAQQQAGGHGLPTEGCVVLLDDGA